jgi:hypothetical protein
MHFIINISKSLIFQLLSNLYSLLEELKITIDYLQLPNMSSNIFALEGCDLLFRLISVRSITG